MSSVLFESLESRSLMSVSIPTPYQAGMSSGSSSTALYAAAKKAAPVVKAPTAVLSAKPITSATSSYTFKVAYHSSIGINLTSIVTGNVTVTGPNGFAQTATLAGTAPSGNGNNVSATYSLTPPTSSSAFTFNANGTYTLSLAANSVIDNNNTPVPAKTLGSFKIQIKVAPPPTAALSAKPVVAVATSYSFTVTYRSAAQVVASSVATGNLSVT